MNRKTILSVLFFLLSGIVCFGQAPQKFELSERTFAGWDTNKYFYTEQGRLDSMYVWQKDQTDDFEHYRLYKYDGQGNCLREDSYQKLNNVWKHTYYLEYSYNENNQLATRLNYNNFDGTFSLGGKLEWIYNDDGTIKQVNTYLSSWNNPGGFDLLNRDFYHWQDGHLVKREFYTVPFGSNNPEADIYLSARLTYTWQQDKMVKVVTENYDQPQAQPTQVLRTEYTYDERDNLKVCASFLGATGNTVQFKYVYHYRDDLKAEQVFFPLNFEDSLNPYYFAWEVSPYAIEKEEWWQVPMGESELQYVGDYLYSYKGSTSIEKVTPMPVNFYIKQNHLYLPDLAEGSIIEIFSISGMKMLQTIYRKGGIALDRLPAGVYVGRYNQMGVFRFVKR